jgi:hypothetical protein
VPEGLIHLHLRPCPAQCATSGGRARRCGSGCLCGWSRVSIRQAYVSIRQQKVSIRQHTPAYVSTRQHTAYVSIRQHTSAYVSIRQHTSAYVSIRQHTCAGGGACKGVDDVGDVLRVDTSVSDLRTLSYDTSVSVLRILSYDVGDVLRVDT